MFLFFFCHIIILTLATNSGLLASSNGSQELSTHDQFVNKNDFYISEPHGIESEENRLLSENGRKPALCENVKDKSMCSSSLLVVEIPSANANEETMIDEEFNRKVEIFIAKIRQQMRVESPA
eukprot:Gb_25453 [translate_table: standard]